MECHPKYVILTSSRYRRILLELNKTRAIKPLIVVFITEVTVVKDHIPSSLEDVLFESVITLSYSSKFDLL